MKKRLLSVLVFASALLLTAHSRASTPLCGDFPEILGASGISGAVTGLPFTFDLRLSCRLGDRFALEGLEGQYLSAEGYVLPKYIATPRFPLPDGNTLYQFLYSIPFDQPEGIYKLDGCIRIVDRENGLSVCLPVSESMSVRTREPWVTGTP